MSEALARYPEKKVTLDVRPWNKSAIRLYTSVGFRKIGAWRDPLGEWILMKYTPSFSHGKMKKTIRFHHLQADMLLGRVRHTLCIYVRSIIEGRVDHV
jgi:RimJ/RimL family protein N-acetyltransferase